MCWPSLARYSWASAIVTSRAFSLATAPTCGGEAAAAVEALVPLADLLNHARGIPTMLQMKAVMYLSSCYLNKVPKAICLTGDGDSFTFTLL